MELSTVVRTRRRHYRALAEPAYTPSPGSGACVICWSAQSRLPSCGRPSGRTPSGRAFWQRGGPRISIAMAGRLAGKSAVPNGADFRRGLKGPFPFGTERRFSPLRDRGRDRRDEPRSDRGSREERSISAPRRVVTGDRSGALRTRCAAGLTLVAATDANSQGTPMRNDCVRSPRRPAATGRGYVRRQTTGTKS